jgi:hypothetical protein
MFDTHSSRNFTFNLRRFRPVLHHEGSTLTKFLWYENDYRWQNRHMPEAVVTYLFSDLLFTSLRDERPSSQWNAKPWRGIILYGTERTEDTVLCTVGALTKWRTRQISLIRKESKNNKQCNERQICKSFVQIVCYMYQLLLYRRRSHSYVADSAERSSSLSPWNMYQLDRFNTRVDPKFSGLTL